MFFLRLFAPVAVAFVLTALTARSDETSPALWSGWIASTESPPDIAAIAQLPDSAFRTEPPGGEATPPRQLWMRLKLRGAPRPDASSTPSRPDAFGLLEVGTRYDDLVELFVPTPPRADGTPAGWQLLRSGESIGPRGRAWPGLSPAFPVSLPADGSELVLHARISEHSYAEPVVAFHADAAAFTAHEQSEISENMLYFGLLAALFAYNLFLYLRLRYRDLLFYLIYLACFSGTMLGGTYTATLLFPYASPLRESILLAALNGALVALLLFVREFHDLPKIAPRLARWTNRIAAFFSIGLLAPLFDYQVPWVHTAFALNFTLQILGLLFVPVAALIAWRCGARQARFFLLAFGLFLAGLIAILLETFGLKLPGDWAERIMRLGSAAEMLLLSFAISDRFRRIRAEKEALQANYTAQLERDVTTRTRELQDTAARLAASNADKDQLVTIIAHDVRTPLVSLLAVARSLHAAAPAEAPALAQGIAQRTGALLALINNLLDWARLHTGQFRHDPAPFALAGIADAVVSALAPLAAEKNLRLENAIPDDLLATADAHAVQCVLRNLVGNALKFTPPGGLVRLDAAPVATTTPPLANTTLATTAAPDPRPAEACFIELRVRDTGPGMPADLLAALATSAVVPSGTGTAGERGAGIGLALCRELIAREGGTLTFACPPAGGTVATVHLPAATFAPAP